MNIRDRINYLLEKYQEPGQKYVRTELVDDYYDCYAFI